MIPHLLEKNKAAVYAYFDSLLLPHPNLWRENCFKTYDGGLLVPLNPFGCLIRVTRADRYPVVTHPPFLTPLGTRHLSPAVRADLFPGLHCPISIRDARDFRETMEGAFAFFRPGELHPGNLGRLPDGQIRIIDPDVLIPDFEAQRVEKRLRAAPALSYVWNRAVGPFEALSQAFAGAWPPGTPAADPEKMRVFWEKCILCKDLGILKSGWNRRHYWNTPDVLHAAAVYEQEMGRSPALSNVLGFSPPPCRFGATKRRDTRTNPPVSGPSTPHMLTY